LYVPGSRFGIVYAPVSSEMVDRRDDVPEFSAVTTQLGIRAPDESRIVPTIVPNVDWACVLGALWCKSAATAMIETIRDK